MKISQGIRIETQVDDDKNDVETIFHLVEEAAKEKFKFKKKNIERHKSEQN